MIFDSHCHINAHHFKGDEKGYIKRANDAGVKYFLVVGWDVASSQDAIKLAEENENVYAAVAIHPVDAIETPKEHLKVIEEMLSHPKVVALGEIGLDYHWVKDDEGKQIEAYFFKAQIEIANRMKKPIIVHMREATNDTFTILESHTPLYSGVMHCYSGSLEMALRFINLGLYIGIGGPVTFKNAVDPKKVAETIPFNRLLVETDAPYISPHPYRGQINESARLPLIVEAIAALRGESVQNVIETTTKNAKTLFNI